MAGSPAVCFVTRRDRELHPNVDCQQQRSAFCMGYTCLFWLWDEQDNLVVRGPRHEVTMGSGKFVISDNTRTVVEFIHSWWNGYTGFKPSWRRQEHTLLNAVKLKAFMMYSKYWPWSRTYFALAVSYNNCCTWPIEIACHISGMNTTKGNKDEMLGKCPVLLPGTRLVRTFEYHWRWNLCEDPLFALHRHLFVEQWVGTYW